MNRAILIVICDFIVSAMLSLATGVSPVENPFGSHGAPLDSHTAAMVMNSLRQEQARLEEARKALLDAQFEKGFAASREAEIQALIRQLAESQARSEFLEKKLALTPENSGALTPEQLQAQLEKEIKNRLQLNIRHRDAERELAVLRARQKETSDHNATLREELAARQAELARTQADLTEQKKKLGDAGASLNQYRESLAVREADLNRTRAELSQLEKESEATRSKNREFETMLSFTRGRLSATEKELAESQSRFERAQKAVNTRDLELTEARRRLENLQTVLKNAVSDLSKTRAELATTKKNAEETAARLLEIQKQSEVAGAELKSTRTQLALAEERLRSDVLERYSSAVVRLQLKLREIRLMIPMTAEAEYFLPLVNIGGRSCVVGDFLLLTGNARERHNFDNITDLAYAVSLPEGDSPAQVLSGPLYAPRGESRVGLLEVKNDQRKPLEVLTLSALKQRGIQDLYLFKFSAFGKESSSLEGRCSMNFADGDEYLYIRNTARGTGSELRAEPGDFVLTKQGEFVAVVVAVESRDMGRRQEARCVVFPDNFNWDNVFTMPIAKSPSSDYLESFSRAAQPVLSAIRARENASGRE